MAGLLDLISARNPGEARQTLADLVRGPQNRLRGLLDSPVGFLTDALNDVVPTGQQAAEQLQRYQLPMSQDYAMGPSGYDNKLKDMALAGLTVYHGSPHKFDKFDMNKIGTGEGAQAYGHGLYFAEAPEVAQSYVGKASTQIDKRPDGSYLAMVLDPSDKPFARQSFKSKELAEAFAKESQAKFGDGSMYKVDIQDEAIAKMLDWDKPLSQQSKEVQKALLKHVQDTQMNPVRAWETIKDMTGGEAYNTLAGRNQHLASGGLLNNGVSGIRYLDGGSRGAGSGTSNYVVFDDSLLKILERNGMPVP